MSKSKILCLVMILAVALMMTGTIGWSAQKTIVPIGVMYPLSGDFASYGARARAVLEKAEIDINKFVQEADLPIVFEFYHEDTETKANITLDKVKAFAAKGVKLVVGALDSSDIRMISGYVNANKIVTISTMSTVAELGIPDDYIFRPIPHDDAEGVALAKLVSELGYTHVALLVRKDPCDISIANKFTEEFSGEILTHVDYAGGTKEFSNELLLLERAVGPAIKKYGTDKIAVVSLTWEDLAQIYSQAQARNSVILSVKWTGGDAVAHSSIILEEVGSIAAEVGTISPMSAAPDSSKKTEVVEYVNEKLGETPDIYSLSCYDGLWLGALSVLVSGKYDGEAIKKVLPFIANSYYGATGWTKIDECGDRTALDVDFLAVKIVNGVPKWEKIAQFNSATAAVTRTEEK